MLFIVKIRRFDWHKGKNTERVVDAETHTEAEEKVKRLVGGPEFDKYEALSCLTVE